jgi:hypothetical protein
VWLLAVLLLAVSVACVVGTQKEQGAMTASVEDQCIKIANDYVQTQENIPASQFRMTFKGLDNATGLYTVDAIHQDDINPPGPVAPGGGSGKSRQLKIDLQAKQVKSALRFQ